MMATNTSKSTLKHQVGMNRDTEVRPP